MNGRVLQVNASRGGVPKTPLLSAVVGRLGIEGDEHRYHGHGGLRKALLLIASEVVDQLCGEGWPLFYGALGENITTRLMDHRSWRAGSCFRLGEVTLELTEPRTPCSKLDVYGAGLKKRIYDQQVKAGNPASARWGESGFYASVLKRGSIQPDDIIEPLDLAV